MPIDVRNTIKDILMIHGNLLEIDANEYLKQMDRDKRYNVEVWS